jgi:protein SCO1/2
MSARVTRRLVFAAVVSVLVLAAVALASRWPGRQDATESTETSLEQLGQYGEVPAFTLTERHGWRVTRDDLRGLVWVADFIYTECTETCPTQSLQFAHLAQEFSGAADLRLVSITVDPAHDTAAVLRGYAERYAAGDRWWFLTGENREIYCLAKVGFHLGVIDPAASGEPVCGQALRFGPAAAWASHGSKSLIMHSARFVLVDRRGHIRAYHLATDPQSIGLLATNLRTLLRERQPIEPGPSP